MDVPSVRQEILHCHCHRIFHWLISSTIGNHRVHSHLVCLWLIEEKLKFFIHTTDLLLNDVLLTNNSQIHHKFDCGETLRWLSSCLSRIHCQRVDPTFIAIPLRIFNTQFELISEIGHVYHFHYFQLSRYEETEEKMNTKQSLLSISDCVKHNTNISFWFWCDEALVTCFTFYMISWFHMREVFSWRQFKKFVGRKK